MGKRDSHLGKNKKTNYKYHKEYVSIILIRREGDAANSGNVITKGRKMPKKLKNAEEITKILLFPRLVMKYRE